MPALKRFGVPLDLGNFEIRNAKLHQLNGLPTGLGAGDKGRYALDTNTNRLYVWDGAAWGLTATDSDLLQGRSWADVEAAVSAASGAASTGYQEADAALRTEVQGWFSDAVQSTTADHASIRADFATSDNQVRADFAAADTQVRQEFAAGDAATTAAYQAADTQIRQDFAAADLAQEQALRAEQAAGDSAVEGRVTAAFGAADTALGSQLRAEIASADQTLGATLRGEFAAADSTLEGRVTTAYEGADAALGAALRAELADGDADVTAAFTAADASIRADLNAADAAIRTEFSAADQALDATLREYIDNMSNTTGTATDAALTQLRSDMESADADLTSALQSGLADVTEHADDLDAAVRAYVAGLDAAQATAVQAARTFATDRANHTGTQGYATISDFAAGVGTVPLNEVGLATGSVDVNGQRIVRLGAPTTGTDAVNRDYVDAIRAGISLKQAVRLASTGNVDLGAATTGDQVLDADGNPTYDTDGDVVATGTVVDGYAVNEGDRVLLKNQTDATENGIYVAGAGGWALAPDADAAGDIVDGTTVWVSQGVVHGDQAWSQINTPDVFDTDGQEWAQQGRVIHYAAGPGLTANQTYGGGTLSVLPGLGITTDDNSTAIDTEVVVRKVSGTVPAGQDFAVLTHNLGTRFVIGRVFENSGTYDEVEFGMEHPDANTLVVRFGDVVAEGQYSFVIVG